MYDAVRPDLADVRLADRVFAPHYAAPLPRRVMRAIALRSAPGAEAAVVAELDAGGTFDLLDVTGGRAWGIAANGSVGYLPADALGAAA